MKWGILLTGLIKNSGENRQDLKDYEDERLYFLLGSSIVIFSGNILFLQTIFLSFRLHVNVIPVYLSVLLTVIYFTVFSKKANVQPRNFWVILFSLISVILSSLIISSFFIDVSWDGRDYHQKAITNLIEGWNPIYETLQPEDVYYNVWLNHYPKAPWILAASFRVLISNVEVGKAYNFLAVFSVFFSAISLFLIMRQPIKTSIVFAILIALNPVSVTQLFTHYIDGMVSSFLSLFLIFSIILLKNKNLPDWAIVCSLVATIAISINIKFTGTFYLFFLALSIGTLFLVRRLKDKLNKYIYGFLLGLFIGVIMGYNPYVTNTIKFKNPFYPTISNSKYNASYVMSNQIPSNFLQLPGYKKLLLSIFSRSQNVYGYDSGPIKFPLSISLNELKAFVVPDTRVGGWGPLFGFGIIFSLILCFYLLVSRISTANKISMIIIMAGILIGVLSNPESWWARYAPHFWLIGLLPLVFFKILIYPQKKLFYFLGIIALLINLTLVATPNVISNLKHTIDVREKIKNLNTEKKIFVYYGVFNSTENLLSQFGIQFELVKSKDCLFNEEPLLPGVFYSYESRCY